MDGYATPAYGQTPPWEDDSDETTEERHIREEWEQEERRYRAALTDARMELAAATWEARVE